MSRRKDIVSAVTNSQEERARFFFKNVEFLLESRYKLQADDLAIIQRYPFLVETEQYRKIFCG